MINAKTNTSRLMLGLVLGLVLSMLPEWADACEVCSDSLRCQNATIGNVGSMDCVATVGYRNGELWERTCDDTNPPYCGGQGGYWCMFFWGVC